MTKKLQQDHQAFPEFYMQWILAIRDLQMMPDNRFSAPLIDALNKRLNNLKNNMIFKAALYLDPRFTFFNSSFFNPEEKEEIQVNIFCLSDKIKI